MKPSLRNIVVWLVIVAALTFLIGSFQKKPKNGKDQSMTYTQFLDAVAEGQVVSVRLEDKRISGTTKTGVRFSTYSPDDPDLVRKLSEAKVDIVAEPPDKGPSFLYILIQWFPMLLLIGVWLFFMRQIQGAGGKTLGFGRSRARLLNEKTERITFDDVAGIEEAKEELEEIIAFLRDPKKFQRLGGKIPRGVLLIGPPGTGKTLLARAVAGEADVPFFSISGSDFVEMFVGVGASRVRDMFEQGKKNAPCIIFVDEIDAVGRHRGAGLGGGNDEREQTLNQLLVEMDGFETNEGVILISATNRPDVLDPALLRPGRFDRQVVVPNPDIDGREKILLVHLRKVPQAPNVDARQIARGTPGFSGADLANLVNEAALLAARRDKRLVTLSELEDAKDKVLMGSERKSMVMSEEERRLTAYHESGHAIAALSCPASDPVHKATIIPRGRALGMVMRLPARDHISLAKDQLEANIIVAMGGRIAEEMIFGKEKITTGAASDIQQATAIARRMVTEWGMSDELGPIRYQENQEEVFLGHSVARQQNISEATANAIDAETRRFIEQAYKNCEKILKKNKKQLHTLAKALLTFETLSGQDINDVLAGRKLAREIKPRKPAATKKRRASLPDIAVAGLGMKGMAAKPQAG